MDTKGESSQFLANPRIDSSSGNREEREGERVREEMGREEREG